jgi:hypothetical protein
VASRVRRWWRAIADEKSERFEGYVLLKAALVTVVLILMWALKEKDVIVVYMKF